jgi:hypothetical protein
LARKDRVLLNGSYAPLTGRSPGKKESHSMNWLGYLALLFSALCLLLHRPWSLGDLPG